MRPRRRQRQNAACISYPLQAAAGGAAAIAASEGWPVAAPAARSIAAHHALYGHPAQREGAVITATLLPRCPQAF